MCVNGVKIGMEITTVHHKLILKAQVVGRDM